jgi:PAS domain-containing protein
VFYMFDTAGRFVRWNHQFSQLTGYTDAELATMRATDFFTGDDQRGWARPFSGYSAKGSGCRGGCPDQGWPQTALPLSKGDAAPSAIKPTCWASASISVSSAGRGRRWKPSAHLQTLVNTIPDLIWLKDGDGTYLACNPEFERSLARLKATSSAKPTTTLCPLSWLMLFVHDRAAIAAGKATRNEEWVTYASDGRRVLLETTKMPMRTPDGRLVGVLGIGHDITEREAHQKQLEHIAHFDTLTGLPNRVLLADRLHQAMMQAQRHNKVLAVAYIDLDGFKAINDQYGHDVGDRCSPRWPPHESLLARGRYAGAHGGR